MPDSLPRSLYPRIRIRIRRISLASPSRDNLSPPLPVLSHCTGWGSGSSGSGSGCHWQWRKAHWHMFNTISVIPVSVTGKIHKDSSLHACMHACIPNLSLAASGRRTPESIADALAFKTRTRIEVKCHPGGPGGRPCHG